MATLWYSSLSSPAAARCFPSGRGRPQHPHCAGKGTGAVGGSPAGVPGISSPAAAPGKAGMPSTTGVRSRERAVRTMEQLLERMEAGDSREEAQALRAQLEHLLPTVWEEELSGQIQALFRSKTAQDV